MTTIHAIRLRPGQDLRISLDQFAKDRGIRAGWIVSCVGSLTQYNLRFANQQAGEIRKDFFEIISLNGTLGVDGGHFHIAVSNGDGTVTGGHLLEGCIIYTTAEIVIEETTDLVFTRELDGTTEWKELQIKKNANK